jgi:hypothetical protein
MTSLQRRLQVRIPSAKTVGKMENKRISHCMRFLFTKFSGGDKRRLLRKIELFQLQRLVTQGHSIPYYLDNGLCM